MQTFGRRRIYTELEITEENLPKILNDAMAIHRINLVEMEHLIKYYLGKQKILDRSEAYSSGVNNKIVLNYAQSVVRDIVGYTFGKDIEYVAKNPAQSDYVRELVSRLQYDDVSLVDLTSAVFASICGVGYQCTLPSDDYASENGPEIGIKLGFLDPRNTFVIQSYELGNPVLLACTYYKTKTKTVYTVYDKEYKTVYSTNGTLDNAHITTRVLHKMGEIPISIIENNHFLMGDFETALTIFDAINQVASDSVNDIENFVQSLLVFVNASLGDDEAERTRVKKDIKENRIIEIKSSKGLQSDAKYITQQMNPENSKTVREYLEESLWKILGIPDRKTRSGGGGDTGDAVKLRDGWADIEVVARNKEKYFRKAKRQQLVIATNLLKVLNVLPIQLKVKDIDIKFSRNKNDNLQTKTQAFSTLVGTNKLDPADCLEMVDITTNVTEMIARGEKYQDKMIQKNMELQKQNSDPNNSQNNKGVDNNGQ